MKSELQQKINRFLTSYKPVKFLKGEIIIRGDDEPTGVYFIDKGFVKMSSLSEDGRETAINIFKPNAFFPMTWAIGNIKNTYYFRAISPVIAYRVPKEELLNLLVSNPEILLDLTSRVLIGMDGLIYNLRSMLNVSSIKKVAIVIKMLSNRFGVTNENNEIEISINMTHQDISHFAGIARETASIALLKLKEKGVIRQKDKKIIIPDLKKLEEI